MPPPVAAYDILIDPEGTVPIGLTFARQPGSGAMVQIVPDPGIETTDNPVYNRFYLGACVSEEFVPGSYGWTEPGDARSGTFVLPGPKVTEIDVAGLVTDHFPIRASVLFGNDLYFFGGRYVLKFTNGTGTPSLAKDFGANVGCGNNAAAVFTDGTTTWLAVGTVNATTDVTDHLWTTTDGTTWTEHDGTGGTDLILCRANVTVAWDYQGSYQYRLVSMPSRTTFRHCAADPTVDANYTAEVQIDNGIHPVNSIVATEHTVIFVTLGGVVWVDARGYSANTTRYWEQSYSLVNGAAALEYDGMLFASWAHNLDMVPLATSRQGRPIHCQPGDISGNGSPIAGYIPAMCVDHGALVAFVYNPNTLKTYMMYGKRKPGIASDEENPMIWHGALAVFDGAVSHARVHSPADGSATHILVWTNIDTNTHCYSVATPDYGTPYQDLIQGGRYEFERDFAIFFPDGWNAPTSYRSLYRTSVHSERLGGTAHLSVYANRNKELDSSGERVWDEELTTYTSPRASQVSPNATDSIAYRIDFKVTGAGEPGAPPKLDALAVYADVNREQSQIYQITCWVEQGQEVAGARGPDLQDAEGVISNLWNTISTFARPIDIIGPRQQQLTVQFQPNGFSVRATENREGKFGYLVTFQMRVLYGVFYWDSGITYDGVPIYT